MSEIDIPAHRGEVSQPGGAEVVLQAGVERGRVPHDEPGQQRGGFLGEDRARGVAQAASQLTGQGPMALL